MPRPRTDSAPIGAKNDASNFNAPALGPVPSRPARLRRRCNECGAEGKENRHLDRSAAALPTLSFRAERRSAESRNLSFESVNDGPVAAPPIDPEHARRIRAGG